MMRAKGKATFLDAMKETTSPVSPAAKEALKEDEWEVRPGGMLVQKRGPDSDAPAGAPVPTIRLKVKFNGGSHEIYINSQASFAEEDDVGQDRAAPRGPEGALQEQGDGLQGLPRHVRRQGPLQAGAARGPRRAGQAPHRAAPHRQGPARRQVHLPHQPRRRQARHQGVRAADHRRQGREGGGGRRGRPHRGAHDGAGQAGRHRRRRRGQGAAANAGEAGAEVRGDAGRHPRQEHGQRPRQERGGAQGQRQRQWPSQGRPVAAPAAAAATRLAAAAVQAAAGTGDREGCCGAAHGELGDVRPAVVNAVDVLGHGDHHHGSGDDHDEAGRQQQHLADPAVRLGALLATTRVPPVTAWYMASLISFSCIHQINRPLSALLCSIRSDPIRPI